MFLFVLQLDWRLEHTSLKQIFNFEFVVIETIFLWRGSSGTRFPPLGGLAGSECRREKQVILQILQ